jgi:hypothetical protein
MVQGQGVLISLFWFLSVVRSSRAPDKSPALPKEWCNEREGTLTATTGECMCRYTCEGKGCQQGNNKTNYFYHIHTSRPSRNMSFCFALFCVGQGMVWYSYRDCPSGCRCLPKKVVPLEVKEKPLFASSSEEVLCSESKPDDCGGENKETAETASPPQPVSPRAVSTEPEKEQQHGGMTERDDDEYDDYQEDSEPSREPEVVEEAVSQFDEFLDWLDENYRLIFGGFIILLLCCTMLPTLAMLGGSSAKAKAEPTAEPSAKKADTAKTTPVSKDDAKSS